jgi:hypothetical protein
VCDWPPDHRVTLTEMEALLTAEGETGSRIGQRLRQGETAACARTGKT